MAILQVDLSEYDMLRESKAKAEAEVKSLKKEIEDLKNSSSCVVVEREVMQTIDIESFKRGVLELYKQSSRVYSQSLAAKIDAQLTGNASSAFNYYTSTGKDLLANDLYVAAVQNVDMNALTYAIENAHILYGPKISSLNHEIKEIRGFSEVKDKIEEQLEKQMGAEMRAAIEAANHEKDLYSAKNEELLAQFVKDFEDKKAMLESSYKLRIASLVDRIEKQKEVNADLTEKLREASKSNEEKLKEAEERLSKAYEEVDALRRSAPRKKFLGIL